jgi:hypothetical protein
LWGGRGGGVCRGVGGGWAGAGAWAGACKGGGGNTTLSGVCGCRIDGGGCVGCVAPSARARPTVRPPLGAVRTPRAATAAPAPTCNTPATEVTPISTSAATWRLLFAGCASSICTL